MALINIQNEQDEQREERWRLFTNTLICQYGVDEHWPTPVIFKQQLEIKYNGENYIVEKGTLAYIENIYSGQVIDMFFYSSAWSGDYISLPFEICKKDDGHIVVYSETGDEISSLLDIVTEEHPMYNETQQFKDLKENFDKARAKFTSNICTCEILLLIVTGAIMCLSGLLIKRAVGSAVAICAVSVIWILLVCAINWTVIELFDYEDTKKREETHS